MEEFSTQRLLHAIKRVAIQKVTRNGFDDNRLYDLENLSHCTDEELADFAELNKIVGQSSSGVKDENKIKMADNGFTDEEYEQAEQAEKKKKEKRELTPEEQELLRRKREIAEQRKTRISILRGVSIRMPMLIYGCKVDQNGHEIKADEEITLEQFIDNVDDASWQEFMPEGVTKEMLRTKFAKYYDEEVFVGAGIDIRLRALAADYLAPSERVMEIGEIFKSFKNPDKETVLTPWKVVNTHISSTLGGADFNHIIELDEEVDKKGEKLGLPNWEDKGEVTRIWSNENAKVLEINSKSGLYPLLCAYNFYDQALTKTIHAKHTNAEDVFRRLWDEILERNIYVLTKSPMAKTITERTLAGYTGAKTNVVYIPELIEKLKDEDFNLNKELADKFGLEGVEMLKFDAVVGNPPYQETKGGTKNIDIWPLFVKSAVSISNNASLIHPGRWLIPKKQMRSTHDDILNSGLCYFNYFENSADIFPGIGVDGGITITMFKTNFKGDIQYAINNQPCGVFSDGAIFFANRFEEECYNKVHQKLRGAGTMLDRILGNIGSLGGSEFGYHKHTQIYQLHDTQEGLQDPVQIWANSGFGKGSRFDWHYIERSELKNIPQKLFSSRKVMIDKKGHSLGSGSGNIINNIPQIVPANATASGDVLFVYPEKDTDTDLELIKSLFMTKTARFLMSITQKDLCARGFENIPDYILLMPFLHTKRFTDKFFYDHFQFSNELIAHIESHVSAKE